MYDKQLVASFMQHCELQNERHVHCESALWKNEFGKTCYPSMIELSALYSSDNRESAVLQQKLRALNDSDWQRACR